MKKLLAVFLLLMLLGAAPATHAAYLYSWSVTPSQSDPTDGSLLPGRDILAAWHAFDSGFHYFRLDLRGAPDAAGSSDFAGTYGIYIDSKSGGASGSHPYVPDPLGGIDYIVDSHFDPWVYAPNGWGPHDYHTWNGTTFVRTDPIAEQQTENAGTTLEWQISAADIGTSFAWWAATHDFGSSPATYDVTTQIDVNPVPIPGAVLLFGSGLLGLLGFRKKLAR
jgi:hypothetical protein